MAVQNPTPPSAAAAGDPVPSAAPSIGRRSSFTRAAFGLAAFWLPVGWMVLGGRDYWLEEKVFYLGAFLALILHAGGIGVAFTAPRGRRLAPVLLNLIALTVMGAIVIACLILGEGLE